MCLSANKSSPTSNKSLHKVVVDWNKLPDDMLKLIAKHLGFPDFARFGSVCSSWRSLASVGLHLHHKGGRLPWLIVPYYDVVGQAPPANTRDNYCPDPVLGFFSILDGAIHKVDIPELQGRRICGSSFGWLITVHGNSEFQLLRPFTGKVVNLPPLTTFPHVGISEEKHNSLVYIVKDWFRVFPDMVWDTNRMRNQYIYKAITSSNAESPIVIAIPHHHAMLLFYKPGEDNDDPFIWKKIRGGYVKGGSRQRRPVYSDITFYKGDLYALRCRGEVDLVKGLDGPSPTKSLFIKPNREMSTRMYYGGGGGGRNYLVESSTDLLQIERNYGAYIQHKEGEYYRLTISFRVSKLDFAEHKWVEVKNLGDRALFLGPNNSLSVIASDYPGCWGNCIYFCDDDMQMINMGHDKGVFHLGSGNIEKICTINSITVCPRPLWFPANSYYSKPCLAEGLSRHCMRILSNTAREWYRLAYNLFQGFQTRFWGRA